MNNSFLNKAFTLSEKSKLIAVSEIMMPKSGHDLTLWKKNHLLFCYKIALLTIEACRNGWYHQFDAQTTTRCCHGLAFMCCNWLHIVRGFDLENLQQQILEASSKLQEKKDEEKSLCTLFLPFELIELCRLYVIWFGTENDATKIRKTVVLKLKALASLSTNFCTDLVSNLQGYFSNLVANSYHSHYNSIKSDVTVNDHSLSLWAKYISPEYIRKDKRGRLYASSLYSMQMILGFLIHSKSKIALVNDLRNEDGDLKERYVRLFEGDGKSQFRPIEIDETLDCNEPIIVFGGVAMSDSLDKFSLHAKMEDWKNRFAQLVLAHETSYPQFKRINDDPNFLNLPIKPQESSLKKTLLEHSKFSGFSLKDPSLCCLSHIYPASLMQIRACLQDAQIQEPLPSFPLSKCF